MGLEQVKNHAGKTKHWSKLAHDELLDMSQFPTRKKLEISERKDSGSKHKRTLSFFADCMVCHNGFKFKWFRPLELLASMKTSKVDDDLLILEWKAGTALDFNLKEAGSVQLCCEARDVLIEEVRSRFGFVCTRARQQTQQRARGSAGGPPSYHGPPMPAFVQPPSYDSVAPAAHNTSTQQGPAQTTQFSTVNVDHEGLMVRAVALGYPSAMVRLAMSELVSSGTSIDINKLLDRLN